MASFPFDIGDFVKIDGKGKGEILELVPRGFAWFYLVRIDGSDYQVELETERLSPFIPPHSPAATVNPQNRENESRNQPGPSGSGSSRFAQVSESDITDFITNQTNKNTLSKTCNDLKLLQAFFEEPTVNESRPLHEIPVDELAPLLSRFFISVRKSNGGEYEPNTLRGMMSSFDRQLRRHNYGEYISTEPKFALVREAMQSKQKQLKRDGKGSMPSKSDAINDNELEMMWETEQFGISSPDSILKTLWFFNTVHFGLRGSAEHRDMCWGDIQLKSDENEHEYLEFRERQTKTRTGENPRDIRVVKPKLFANLDNPLRCPIKIYKVYARKRPQDYCDPSHPFYIASSTKHAPSERETWFKRNPVGVNKLKTMMSRMVTGAGINTDKKLTNHSARKYLVQKLNDNNHRYDTSTCDNNVPANHIMQISGHKNIGSINNYSHINENQHRSISKILHSGKSNITLTSGDNVQSQPPTPIYDAAVGYSHSVSVPRDTHSYRSSHSQQSMTNVHVPGGFQHLFGAPIHGGNFEINIHQHLHNKSPQSFAVYQTVTATCDRTFYRHGYL